MESRLNLSLEKPTIRSFLLVLVTILLNFGLFFILNLLAPLIVGLVIGFLTREMKGGITIGLVGTVVTYGLLFLITEWLTGFQNTFIDITVAVIIMGILGAFGGLIGAYISSKTRD